LAETPGSTAAVAGSAVEITETRFRVMASAAHVILVDADPRLGDQARSRLEELERRWSRFRPDSDVSRLNEAPEALMVVSSDTVALIAAMKEAWRVTEGRYDPTMLAAIVAAGYAASIDGSGRSGSVARLRRGAAARRARATIADVALDPVMPTVTLPAGVGLDPGGIGKGLAADLVVTELLEAGAAGALVCVGGDLAAAGRPPTAAGWPVSVEDPFDPARNVATFAFGAGGVATSSTCSRTWLDNGVRRHHAIDPETGTSATTDLAAVTVVARAGWEAEAHATAALLCGAEHVLDYLERRALDGFAVSRAGEVLASRALSGAGILERGVA
jgi:thiamine biosynthesis lipoprotein